MTTASAPRRSSRWRSSAARSVFGLRRNVIALYKFACRNYRDADDELFGFGFSRGAFTIRIVMGLIDSQGLVKADNEAELAQPREGRLPRLSRERYKHLRLEAPYQWIRNKFGPHYPPGRCAGTSRSGSSASGTRLPPTACRSTK